MRFTDKYLRSLQPQINRYDVLEGDGFTVRVTPSGTKTFCFCYQMGGKNRRMTLGTFPAMPLAEARALHRQCLDRRARGEDPAGERTAKIRTLSDLSAAYLKGWAKLKKKSWKEDERILNRDILPILGKMEAATLSRHKVSTLLSQVEATAPNHAWQMLKILRRMYNWALEQSLPGFESNPCTHIKMAAPRVKKDRSLSEEEIRLWWYGMARLRTSHAMKDALRTILVTGQRPGEVLALHQREIDGDWWTIPSERAKNGRAHRVFLTATAKELIGDIEGYPFGLFDSPMQTSAAGTAIRRMLVRKDGKGLGIAPFTPHDLRRTCATHLGRMGYPNHLIGRLLNHTDQSVTGIYNRHEYDKEKREMLEAWETELWRILKKDPPAGE